MPAKIIDLATPAVESLAARAGGKDLREVIARGATNAVQSYLRRINTERPNKLGGDRTNFYSAAARKTSYQVNGDKITISINHLGMRQRYEGGVIRPVEKKRLAIPATAEAYGKSPTEFQTLRYVRFGRGADAREALVIAAASQIKLSRRKDGTVRVKQIGETGGQVMFWLRKSVTQKPDPTVLPERDDIARAGIEAAERFLAPAGPVHRVAGSRPYAYDEALPDSLSAQINERYNADS